MTSAPMRRIAWALVAYAGAAWIAIRLGGWMERVLALPPMFRTLGIGILIAGLAMAVLLGWRYPELGARSAGEGSERGESQGR